jgi:GntR family transcriptional regulator
MGRRCCSWSAGSYLPRRGKAELVDRQVQHVNQQPLMVSSGPRRRSGFPPSNLTSADHHLTKAEIRRVQPPADVAERLDVPVDEPSVVQRTNHYFADDEPVQIGLTYIPWTIAGDTALATDATSPGSRLTSIYAEFERLGYRLAKVREEITARMPRPDEVAALQIPPGVPVIHVLHTGLDQRDRPFEVTRFTMRADLNGLDYWLPVED